MKIKYGGMNFPSIPVKNCQMAWKDAIINIRPSKRSIYIHIPFCHTRCPFCPFYLQSATENEIDEYINLLITELKDNSEYEGIYGELINTVYIGGGTPSDLSAKQLSQILKTIHKYYKLANDCEITLEGRVNNFTKEKIAACIENGVNRFSIGIQTFNTKLRQLIGRLNNTSACIETLNSISSFNQAAVVIDLLYGIPKQTIKDWIEDNRIAATETEISGLDHYNLKLYDNLKLKKIISQYKLKIPDEKEKFKMYKIGSDLMSDFGATRLSIHHYSFDYRERNAHNDLAAQRATCIQYGMKAAGRIGGYFFRNTSKISEYRKYIIMKQKPISYAGKLTPEFKISSELNYQIIKKLSINPHIIGKKDINNYDKILNIILKEIEMLQKRGIIRKSHFGFYKLSDEALFNYKSLISNLTEKIAKIYN